MISSTISFIRELYGKLEGQIPLHVPEFKGNEKNYVIEALEKEQTSTTGDFISRFENALTEYTGAADTVAVSNGTAALHVALHLSGVRSGEEVITQALTFVATGNAILYTGAKPVFVDVDLDTMGMSPDALRSFLNTHCESREGKVFNKQSGKRIAAVLPMHTLGFPVRIKEIVAICKEWNLPIVEDAAEALGSKVEDQHAGTFGSIGTLSFNGNKTITCGGGGALLFQDKGLADKARSLINTAKRPHTYEYFHEEMGFNYALPNLNAALALGQMENLVEILYQKRALGYVYNEHFERHSLKLKAETSGTKANFWLMTLELENRESRTHFLDELNKAGISCRPIWTLLNKFPMFAACQSDDLSNSQYLEDRIVNIPSSVKSLKI